MASARIGSIDAILHESSGRSDDPSTHRLPRGPVRRSDSQAVLNLKRVFQQNRRSQKKDGTAPKVPDPITVPQTKGKPRLLLMGQRRYVMGLTLITKKRVCERKLTDDCHCRSGKSSISSVVFHKLPPSETLFLESTARIQKDSLKYGFSRPL